MNKKHIVSLLVLFVGLTLAYGITDEKISLENESLIVSFNENGIESIFDKRSESVVTLNGDVAQLRVGSQMIETGKLEADRIEEQGESVQFTYTTEYYSVRVIYELKENWRFVSKQIMIDARHESEFVVNDVCIFHAEMEEAIQDHIFFKKSKYGMSLRLRKSEKNLTGSACFMTVQNPFSSYEVQQHSLTIEYAPEMKWKKVYGSFLSDRLCIGFADITGRTRSTKMLPEWKYVEDPEMFIDEGDKIDMGEIQAMTECMRAFLMVNPKKSNRVHVGWCENDYQVDISTTEGNLAYKRIIDRAIELGNDHMLFTGSNNLVAPLSESRDAWGWENVLWFNMGQKLRKGEYKPGDPLPESVQDIVDYAKGKGIGLIAYVYPSMPFMQDSAWTAWRTSNGKKVQGYSTVDTGLRSYQDWLVNQIIAFVEATGCTGVSFDHWWIAYEGDPQDTGVQVTSKYQQWYGCRRVLEQLRERAPDLIIDGRQQYHHFGTWTWLAGTYPHPMMSDEQPGSFNAIPDLSTDRVNGARQRYVAYGLMTQDFTPIEILPGFMTHQTQRFDSDNKMHWDRFRAADWDYLGWKYSLLSSVATAPFNHVINYIPARDEMEFSSFSASDKAFFNYWLDFTDEKSAYMKHVMPIIGPPMVGRCDGTSAIVEDNGYLFVFNPNYRSLDAAIQLNESIGLTKGEKFILKEMYPSNGAIIPDGVLHYGDKIALEMPGISAKVFRIEPWKADNKPLLINSEGECRLESGTLVLTGIKGAGGSKKRISVLLPEHRKIKRLTVNGTKVKFRQKEGEVSAEIQFEGSYFPKAKSLVPYDATFQDSLVTASLTIPSAVFSDLEKRRLEWPMEYTTEDKIAPWLDPARLLLYIQIAEPYRDREPIRKQEYELKIDGLAFELNEAYNGVYPTVKRSNLGVFVDISSLDPDISHKIEVKLPAALRPGQFQGIFIEHVENQYTTKIEK